MTYLPINETLNSNLVALESPNLTESFIDGEKFVVFYLGDELFAISAQKVSEVVQPLEITHLPNVPEWLLGITNLRGEVISIINLPKLWQIPIYKSFAKPNLIILRKQTNTIALASDKLSEIISLPEETIQLCEADSHLFATAIYRTQNLKIIDVEKLFSSIRLGF